jgi:hypothetical protein
MVLVVAERRSKALSLLVKVRPERKGDVMF